MSGPALRIVRVKDVKAQYGFHPNSVKRWEDEGLFPERRRFGGNITGWWRAEFEAALNEMATRNAGQ